MAGNAYKAVAENGSGIQAKPTRIEISVKGKWFDVPALEVNGKHIIVKGKVIRTACVEAEQWLETELEDPEQCVQILKQQQRPEFHADILSFRQKLPATVPKYQYPMEWDSLAVVRVSTFKEWWDNLPQETRKNVRRSQKRGVVVRLKKVDDNLIRDLRDLNNDSALRQGKRFTHYGKTLDQVARDQEAYLDRSDYVCAYCESELVGVSKLVYQGNIASILTFLTKASHQDKRPSNAVMAKMVELCEEKKIGHLIFGMFNYGNKHHTSLREFKIRNGFKEILVPHYYVPLTMKGVIYIKLGLHRGLMGILPHGIITFAVNTRSKLFSFAMGRCSSTSERSNRNRQMECSSPPAGSTRKSC